MSPVPIPSFASLLQGMTPEQVLSLIQEKIALSYKDFTNSVDAKNKLETIAGSLIELDLDDYRVPVHAIYIIDPFDIIGFCFPFGFDMHKAVKGSELDLQSDSLTAWDDFFRSSSKIVLMDEHRPELSRLRNRLVRDMQSSIEGFEEFENLVVKVYTQSEQKEIPEKEVSKLKDEILYKRISWLVAAATGEIHKGPDRFSAILKKLVINNDQFDESMVAPWLEASKKEEHIDFIKEVFLETPAGENAFKEYINMIDILESRQVDVDQKRRDNLLGDYKVVDRLLKINKKLAEAQDKLGCRYVFFYLSSDNKSEFIRNDINDRCPPVLGEPLNLVRNVAQLYLNYLFSFEQINLPGHNPRSLDSLEAILQNYVLAHNTIKSRLHLPDGPISKRIAELRERVEWSGHIKNIYASSGKFESAFDQLIKRATFEPLKQALEELIVKLRDGNVKDSIEQLEKEIRNFSIEVTVLQKIVSILDKNPTPDISSLGYIVGINHHLPTLFEMAEPDSIYQSLMESTVALILSPNDNGNFSKNLKSIASDLKTTLLSDGLPDIQPGQNNKVSGLDIKHYQRQCLLHLFALLLPAENIRKQLNQNDDTQAKHYNLDSELDELLSYDINSLKLHIRKSEKAKKHEIASTFKIILHNLLYIRVWALRRNGKLDECDILLEELEADQETAGDIRFIHGRALLSYSRMLRNLEDNYNYTVGFFDADEGIKRQLKKTRNDVEKALNAFSSYEGEKFNRVYLDKADSALLNTLIYVEVLAFAMMNDVARLKRARSLVNEGKRQFNKERKSHPEYLHTEANLEYMEALNYQKTESGMVKAKIGHAKDAIDNCLKIYQTLFPQKEADTDYIKLKVAINLLYDQYL
jgi:hypothetical protein